MKAAFQPQGAVGDAPAAWANELQNVPNVATLPTAPMYRQDVRNTCRDANTDVLFAYICAMAWGGQNDRYAQEGLPGQRAQAWENRDAIRPALENLRANQLNHDEAYNLFTERNAVPGLGPSYFTKLIYFFSPDALPGQVGFYIMDQWTAKSVNLLTQTKVVRIAKLKHASPDRSNKSGNFEAYCREVEMISVELGLIGQHAGDQVEQRLMSQGGHNPWQWRSHVKEHWLTSAPIKRYSRKAMPERYPKIPANRF